MAEIWEKNEEISEDEELVVTDHRDSPPEALLEAEQSVEVTSEDPRDALREQGEDVSSSPSRRGHDNHVDSSDDADMAEED